MSLPDSQFSSVPVGEKKVLNGVLCCPRTSVVVSGTKCEDEVLTEDLRQQKLFSWSFLLKI